ncbi:MAG: GNAT family N-acetyltransferase [Desulfobacterales bacterium]|nr:GNAT family N-acetyltransferase [Desulfobacterales bacterium]
MKINERKNQKISKNDGIMLVRTIRRSDRPHIAALQTESWQDSYADVLPESYLTDQLAEDLKRYWGTVQIKPEDIVMVAEAAEVIGFIAIWCRPEPFIDNLHVKPSQRSRGIGSMLMASAARQMIQQGHNTAYLWVVESNTQAIRLYQRLGGTCTDRNLKDLFGHAVPNIKIEWSDISTLLNSL